jgi:hypothetical protein
MFEYYPHARRFRFTCLLVLTAGVLAPGPVLADDSTPVVLQSLQFSPTAIDTSTGAAQVTLNFTATDAVSGINYFEAGFVDASGVARQSATARFAPARSASNSLKITFPQFSNAGAWTLASVFLSDAAGNTLVLDTNGLEGRGFPTRLEVRSAKDTVSPRLTALGFSPSEIDTSGGPADVKVNYTATDDLSGVSYVELSFVSPSGVARRGGTVKLEPTRSASNTMNVTFPRFSEAGRWTLSSVFLSDAAGNTLVLNSENLASSGFPTSLDVRSAADTTSPQLTSLHFTPESIDTSQGTSTVKVDFTATDDLSGVKSIEVVFVSPSGVAKERGSALFPPVTQLTNSVNVSFPALSEAGQWALSHVMLADAAGNTLVLDADGVGRLGLRPLQVSSASDTVPPNLTAFKITPETIDTTQGPVTVKVEFTATDNFSGVKSAEVVFVSPSGSFRQSGTALFKPAKEVTGSVSVTFPQSSEPGVWKVGSVIVTDAAGNTLALNEDAMAYKIVRVQ